ncbi:hypothetical protein [Pseudomonas baetica]|uniref:hypothetical protein n=1 Tax=Pseudomonas baetica TaxID=674054 RepID=UPI0021AB33C1|nr:hypothetical protein [Pseudomonas baetica]
MKAREFEHYQRINTSNTGPDTQAMNAISREEFNARIETIEARMDARVQSVSAKIEGFLEVQTERDKALLERYNAIAANVQQIALESKEAVRQASTIKANYWASTAVYFLGIVGIVVATYYANQANVFVAIQTTLSEVQAGKVTPPPNPAMLPLPITPP